MSTTNDQNNPYSAPTSTLEDVSVEGGGSIEATLAGDSELLVGDVLKEAWEKVHGIKLPVLVALIGGTIAIYVVMAVLAVVIGFAGSALGSSVGFMLSIVIVFIAYLAVVPLYAGILLIGLRQSVSAPVSVGIAFSLFDRTLPILGVVVLVSIAVNIGMLLFVLPGLYLMIALLLAMPLLVEKRLGVIESLKVSAQLSHKQFLNLALIVLVVGIVVALSAFTIIGLIWSIPWALMAISICYRNLAGVTVEH
ncbi:MAG: hypothetical protein NXH85_00315 [Pseudomonadaceae bacterium]|nr:hypothetical protein [Pseudomonadaceae bacterium]